MQISHPHSSGLNDKSQMEVDVGYDAFDLHEGTSSWHANGLNNQRMDLVSSDFAICFSRNGSGSPRGRWCKIRAAMIWVSVWKDVAAKKMAELDPFSSYWP